jgi:hypothetical protein
MSVACMSIKDTVVLCADTPCGEYWPPCICEHCIPKLISGFKDGHCT